jgi:hypothetical protein
MRRASRLTPRLVLRLGVSFSGFTVTGPHKDREMWFSLRENHESVFRFGLYLL